MKKTLIIKILVVLSILMVVVITVVVGVSLTRKNNYFYYLTIPESYYLEGDLPTFNVNIYSNHPNDYYLNEQTIEEVRLKSKDDFYNLRLNQVVQEKKYVVYDEKEFYKYRLNFTLPLKKLESLQINNASLEFDYASSENISLKIGTIIHYNSFDNAHLNISLMKGVVNNFNEQAILSGIGFTISSNADIVIKKITSLDNRININGENVKKMADSTYNNATLMSNLLETDYAPQDDSSSFLPISVLTNTENHYLFPLSYQELVSVNTLGFDITYEYNHQEYHYLVRPFKFFSSSNSSYELVKYDRAHH